MTHLRGVCGAPDLFTFPIYLHGSAARVKFFLVCDTGKTKVYDNCMALIPHTHACVDTRHLL